MRSVAGLDRDVSRNGGSPVPSRVGREARPQLDWLARGISCKNAAVLNELGGG